jgi:hypothetical protein
LYVDIHNDRPDIAALESTAKLSAFWQAGQQLVCSPIRSPLKATARPGFTHTIFPKSHEAFDLLCIGWNVGLQPPTVKTPATRAYQGSLSQSEARIYLNSALDVYPVPDLPITSGVWILRFEFFAIDFPVLTVDVELDFTLNDSPQARILEQVLD